MESANKQTKKKKKKKICKYFLDALEKSQYGWFWECPNGQTCHYRHALPPGFVLKKDKKKKEDEEEDTITLEEYLETEVLCNLFFMFCLNLSFNYFFFFCQRSKIKGGTPVTEESFKAWKKARLEKKKLEEEQKAKEKEAAVKAGKGLHVSFYFFFFFLFSCLFLHITKKKKKKKDVWS